MSCLRKKLSARIAVFRINSKSLVRNFVTCNTLKSLYVSLVNSPIIYGIEVWGAVNKTQLQSTTKFTNEGFVSNVFRKKL